ncbi:hypothetical protein NDU88_003472 [Pleurodeles waltl]|uniref:Uncharacterized protein n=1 Tax=Pleurodeles waltl TaxID=8319 RepID=A0AAV7UDE7_PLEWA|nr:hypothetical protein NDU88_003472 [Pleurodeles waltl]
MKAGQECMPAGDGIQSLSSALRRVSPRGHRPGQKADATPSAHPAQGPTTGTAEPRTCSHRSTGASRGHCYFLLLRVGTRNLDTSQPQGPAFLLVRAPPGPQMCQATGRLPDVADLGDEGRWMT